MNITIDKEELKNIIKIAIKEIIEEERLESFLASISNVSKEEMDDIKGLYGKPKDEIAPVYIKEIDI